jgi:hypothetical protein
LLVTCFTECIYTSKSVVGVEQHNSLPHDPVPKRAVPQWNQLAVSCLEDPRQTLWLTSEIDSVFCGMANCWIHEIRVNFHFVADSTDFSCTTFIGSSFPRASSNINVFCDAFLFFTFAAYRWCDWHLFLHLNLYGCPVKVTIPTSWPGWLPVTLYVTAEWVFRYSRILFFRFETAFDTGQVSFAVGQIHIP